MLTIDFSTTLRAHLCVAAIEPNNTLYTYGIDDKDMIVASKAAIANENYNNQIHIDYLATFSSRHIVDIGVKTWSQVGASIWYREKYSNSVHFVTPVHSTVIKYAAPTYEILKANRTITIRITDPTNIAYECYRFIMRKGYEAIEYVSYDKTFSFTAPSTGAYQCTIIGYLDNLVSRDSPIIDTTISDSETGFPILPYNEALSPEIVTELDRLNDTKIDALVPRDGFLDAMANGTIKESYAITESNAADAINVDIISTAIGKTPVLPTVDSMFTVENNMLKLVLKNDTILAIELSGASGGKGGGADGAVLGGFGAKLTGSFDLNKGDTLYILLGQQGQDVTGGFGGGDRCTAGGGGMSGVVLVDETSTDKLFGTIPVRPLLIAGGGNGGGDAAYSGTNGANARLTVDTEGAFSTTDYSGGGFRAHKVSTNCGQSFLSGGAAASAVYTRNGSSEAGFGGGGGNKDDGQGGGGGGYYGGICGGFGGSSFNADPNGTAELCQTRGSGSIKLFAEGVKAIISNASLEAALEQPLASIDDTLATKIDNVSVNGDKIIFNANDTKVSEVDNGAIFVDKEW